MLLEGCDTSVDEEAEIFKSGSANADEATDAPLLNHEEVRKEDYTQEHQEHEDKNGVTRTLLIMFSTPENISFFTVVVFSGMCRGFIDTFLFIW